MKSLGEHIQHIHTKPHHVRERVAFTVAGCLTGVVALVWLASNLTLGKFAIANSNFAESTGQAPAVTIINQSGTIIAGAAAAVDAKASSAPHIEVVQQASPIVISKKAEQTIIPF